MVGKQFLNLQNGWDEYNNIFLGVALFCNWLFAMKHLITMDNAPRKSRPRARACFAIIIDVITKAVR